MLLDAMRRHSRSFIIYILFGIIIAVFVVNFGPQSAGCSAAPGYAGSVAGDGLTAQEISYAYSVAGIKSSQVPEPQMVSLRGRVLDQLVMRELLAQDAVRLGFRIPNKEIDDMLVDGEFLALGQLRRMILDDDGNFDYELFSRFVRYQWGLTVKKFKEQQRRELLASKFREVFLSSVRVSPDEVKADYARQNTQIKLTYVRFPHSDFRSKLELSEAKLRDYIDANKTAIKKRYDANKVAYQNLPKQARLAIIQLQAAEDDAEARAAAKAKAEAALQELKGGAPLAAVAQRFSDDEASRRDGGSIGWRNESTPGLWKTAAEEVAKIKTGQLSGVIEDDLGFTIVKVLARREGTLSLDKAEADIAEELLRDEMVAAMALQTATAFHTRATAGESFEDMFETTDDEDEADSALDDPAGAGAADDEKSMTAENQTENTTATKARAPYSVSSTASFPRSESHLIPGIGISEKLSSVAFQLDEGDLAPEVYEVGGSAYLVRIDEREEPDWDEWEEREHELTKRFQEQKAFGALLAHAYDRCAQSDVDIRQRSLVTRGYVPQEGAAPLPTYTPCASFKPEWRETP